MIRVGFWWCDGRFVWDEAKYPTMSPLKEIVDGIHTQVAKIEDDLKVTTPWLNFLIYTPLFMLVYEMYQLNGKLGLKVLFIMLGSWG